MRQILGCLAIAMLLACCNSTKTKSISENQSSSISNPNLTKMNKKELAVAFVEAVTSQNAEKVRELANEDYIQHNPFLPTGLEPFIGLFPVLKENNTKAKQVRIIQDGNYVAIHHLWTGAKPFGAEEMVSFDILRFDEERKIAEHWDALMPNTPPNPSGRTLLDGPTEIKDKADTETNKQFISSLVEDVLFGKNPEKVTDYIGMETYHQHNPQIKDGLGGLQEAFQQLIATNNMFRYTKSHKVLGDGNFVLTINEGEWQGKTQVFYDLFRIENGKAVEHWDIIQPVPTEGLANNNGMFDFK